MKKWWIIVGIIIVLALFAYLIILHNSTINKYDAGTNGTRFVDGITKIATDRNKDYIQTSLDNISYAPIIFEVDEERNVDTVLVGLSESEFKLVDILSGLPKLVSGNATATAILKLQNNPHIVRIYYNYPTQSL